eukprot:5403176-Prymnesium_polylepis.1
MCGRCGHSDVSTSWRPYLHTLNSYTYNHYVLARPDTEGGKIRLVCGVWRVAVEGGAGRVEGQMWFPPKGGDATHQPLGVVRIE